MLLLLALPQWSLALVVPAWANLLQRVPQRSANDARVYDAARGDAEPDWYDAENAPLTLYRERNGWCPYSERVWLTLELKQIEYATVLIDNTGPGPRPRSYGGSTPQLHFPGAARPMGESLDLMRELDERYPETRQLWSAADDVSAMVGAFKRSFPSNARPSSRSAFLFTWDGPLPRRDFEAALDKTEALLTTHDGPFFCGAPLSAADVAWAPFLERYAAQLPALHEGLSPRHTPERWPRLSAWYEAMEAELPEYACRVRGEDESWRRVLAMQGYGNAGVTPSLVVNAAAAGDGDRAVGDGGSVWDAYARDRQPHVAPSPAAQCAARVVHNREAITEDAVRRKVLDASREAVDLALRGMCAALLAAGQADAPAEQDAATSGAAAVARYLEQRVCVPRDMGALEAAELRALAERLESVGTMADD